MATLTQAGDRAEGAVRGVWGRRLARVGFVARGLIYGLVALLALDVAFGKRSNVEDQPGALQAVASHPYGQFLIGALAVGFAAFAFWCFVQAVLGQKLESGEDLGVLLRIGFAALGLLYAWLCVLSVALLIGANEAVSRGGGGHHEEVRATRIALEQPAGRYFVIAVGLAVIGAGLGNVFWGLSERFRKELKEHQMGQTERRWYTLLGVVGFVARGVVFSLVGFFVARAAWQYDPNEAVGLDGALSKLAQTDYGPALLACIAAGLLAYALFCFVEARYREV
jgi:hypothetical protein